MRMGSLRASFLANMGRVWTTVVLMCLASHLALAHHPPRVPKKYGELWEEFVYTTADHVQQFRLTAWRIGESTVRVCNEICQRWINARRTAQLLPVAPAVAPADDRSEFVKALDRRMELPVGGTPLEQWEHVLGPTTLQEAFAALEAPSMDLKASHLVMAVILLGTNLQIPSGAARIQFALDSRLALFCQIHANQIRAVLLSFHRAWREVLRHTEGGQRVALGHGFAADMEEYCPGVLNSSRLRGVSLLHRVYRDISLRDGHGSDWSTLKVARNFAFDTSVDLLLRPVEKLRGELKAQFANEIVEGPGAVREWFTEVAAQIFNQDFGLFEFGGSYTKISPMAAFQDEPGRFFKAVGRFLGLCLLNDNPVGVTLPVMFWARVLGEQLELAEIAEDEPDLFRSFSTILELSDSDLIDSDYEIEIEGVSTRITPTNKNALVQQKVNSLLQELPFIDAVRDGFLDVIPLDTLSDRRISPADLRDLLYGNPEIDIDDLSKHVQYDGGYTDAHPQVQWLFSTLHGFDLDMRQKFLRFVISNPRLPIGGFSALHQPIVIRPNAGGDAVLPCSRTCGHAFFLPLYSSEEILRRSLVIALNADAAMGEK